MRCALVAALLTLSPAVARADCALIGVAAAVLSHRGAVLPRDGGIVVGGVATPRGELDPGDVAVQRTWRLRIGTRSVSPVIEVLAPGLAVYKLPADAADAELEDASHAVVEKVTTTAEKVDHIPAPRIRRIVFDKQTTRRGESVHVMIELDGDAPKTAIAIVLADAKGRPRSWRVVDGGSLYAYSQGECQTLANGTIPSNPGDRVTVFWVDEAGRRSAASRSFVIAANK